MKKYWLFFWWVNMAGLLGLVGLSCWEYFNNTSVYDLVFAGVLAFAMGISVLFLWILRQEDCQKNSVWWLVWIATFLWFVLFLIIAQHKEWMFMLEVLLFYVVSGGLTAILRLKTTKQKIV